MVMVLFIFLSAAVIIFLLTLCLTLFRIERAVIMTMMAAERRIIKNYSATDKKQ